MILRKPSGLQKPVILFFLTFFFLFSLLGHTKAEKISNLFKTAEKEYQAFIKDTSRHKYAEQWERCVNRYREIVFLGEKTIYADDAAYMAGYIYLRMFERFSNQAYLNSSISSFSFLLSHYPKSIYLPKTLYYSGYIYYKYTSQKEKARDYFDLLIRKYPRSKYQSRAKKFIDMMSRASIPISPRSKSKHALMENIKFWSVKDFTRVVVYLDAPVDFKNERLYNPDRIYIDLKNSTISPQIVDRMMIVEDSFLKRVRIGQFKAKTARVVLDFEKVGKYSIFSLNDPFRLVIDITSENFKADSASPELARLKTGPSDEKVRGEEGRGRKVPVKPRGEETNAGVRPSKSIDRNVDAGQKSSSKSSETAVVPVRNSNGSYSLVRQLGLGATTIVIDAGHGGKDPGCVASNGIREKDLTLDIARRLESILEEEGFQVYLTRNKDNYVSLEERTAKAMQYKADIFVSLHVNSHRSSKISGFESYFLGFAKDRQTEALAAKENAINQKNIASLEQILRQLVGAKVEESRDLAFMINSHFSDQMKKYYSGIKSRGVKQAPFIVLIGANMPSVLVEIGYLTNPTEKKRLGDSVFRQRIAKVLASGIESYVGSLKGYSEGR